MSSMTPGAEPAPRPRASGLQTVTYQGAPDGMITAVQKHEIPDGAAYYLQDILVDLPGIIRQRGPLTAVNGAVTFSDSLIGMASCFDPAGGYHAGVLHGTATPNFAALSSNFGSSVDIPISGTLSSSPYTIIDSKGKFLGGSIIGISSQYDEAAVTQKVLVWDGGNKANYTTGTITCNQNSPTVTGSGTTWTTFASPGMYLFNNSAQFIGTVKTVNSDTSITLVNAALLSVAAGAYTLQSLRGINPLVTTGEITCSTGAATVTGANTKFSQQGLASGTWDVYRASDWNFIGTVTSVTNDTSLTLTGNAALNLSVERYFAVKRTGDWSQTANAVGFLNATYANRQWYANQNQSGKGSFLRFSDTIHPEAVDISPNTGDYIPVSSGSAKSAQTPIKGIMAGFNSLLICKEDETLALIGQDTTTFEVHKVWNDGALSGMSMAQWGDKVLFAGRNGIYAWDGTQITDYTVGTLGREYRYAIKNFDPTVSRMWGTVIRDHYLLFIESVVPQITVTKGSVSTVPSSWTVCINMNTGALSLLTNVDIRGSIVLPVAQENAPWIGVNISSGGRLCDGNTIFDGTGTDSFACVGDVAGPSFYMESKRYPLGDPLRRKLLKQVAADYKSSNDLSIDTIIGFGQVAAATTNTTSFPATTFTWNQLGSFYNTWDILGAAFGTWNAINVDVWGKKRYKFLKHENFIGFRLYPGVTPASSVTVGPWQFGFKVQAAGRI